MILGEPYFPSYHYCNHINSKLVHWFLPLGELLHTSWFKERDKMPQGTTKDPSKEVRRGHLLLPILYGVFTWSYHWYIFHLCLHLIVLFLFPCSLYFFFFFFIYLAMVIYVYGLTLTYWLYCSFSLAYTNGCFAHQSG